MKVYGNAGKPVVVFPTRGGRFHEYEDSGMVEACRPFIESGAVTLCTLDGVDHQSWANEYVPPPQRGLRHNQYDRYVVEEAAPFVRGLLPRAEGSSPPVRHGRVPRRELPVPAPRPLSIP